MERLLSVDDWKEIEWNSKPDGSWSTMMARVAAFHSKHDFANPENNGHDMGSVSYTHLTLPTKA